MFWGTALAITAIVTSVVGGAISAYSMYAQGQAQKKQMAYQSQVAQRQAEMAQRAADQNIRLTQYQASEDTKALQRKYMVLQGAQKAAFGAEIGGGSVTEGDIATDTFNTRTLDEQNIRWNADIKSWALRNQAAGEVWGLQTQSDQFTYAGKNAAKAGTIGAVGTIFSSVGSAAGYGSMGFKSGTTSTPKTTNTGSITTYYPGSHW